MGFSLVPKIRINGVTELSPAFFLSRGISLLLLDLDNTLAPYSGAVPSNELFAWKKLLSDSGVIPYIVSNTKTERARRFAALWGVPYIDAAKKPRRGGIERAMAQCGKAPEETALAGDQIFTDVLGANLAGICSIVVEPLELKNFLYTLRYWAETPFRLCRRKERLK